MLMDENASKDILNFKNCQRDGGLLNDCTDEEIMEIIEDCMDAHKNIANPSLEQILQTEAETYERIESRR